MAKSVAAPEPGKRDAEGNDRLAPVKARTEQLGDFLRDVRSETKKVSTPSREQVQSTTLVVVITVFIFAMYFWLVDNLLRYSLDKFIYRFSHH